MVVGLLELAEHERAARPTKDPFWDALLEHPASHVYALGHNVGRYDAPCQEQAPNIRLRTGMVNRYCGSNLGSF